MLGEPLGISPSFCGVPKQLSRDAPAFSASQAPPVMGGPLLFSACFGIHSFIRSFVGSFLHPTPLQRLWMGQCGSADVSPDPPADQEAVPAPQGAHPRTLKDSGLSDANASALEGDLSGFRLWRPHLREDSIPGEASARGGAPRAGGVLPFPLPEWRRALLCLCERFGSVHGLRSALYCPCFNCERCIDSEQTFRICLQTHFHLLYRWPPALHQGCGGGGALSATA